MDQPPEPPNPYRPDHEPPRPPRDEHPPPAEPPPSSGSESPPPWPGDQASIPTLTEAASAREPRPSGTLWMWYLFCRPAVFFRHFVLEPSPLLTALAAWMLGIAGAMDQIGQHALQGELGGGPNPFEFFFVRWSVYWGFCSVLGVVSGYLYFKIGGWWYRVRLGWSGAVDPDASLARRVYLFASQVYAIPAVLYAGWQTTRYASPGEAWQAGDLGWAVVTLFIFWSIYTSYRGVRTAFDVRKWGARLWFVILPGGLYTLIFGGACVVSVLGSGLFAPSPQIQNPQTIDRPGFVLKYPGNWVVDTEDQDYDPDAWFQIMPMWGNAVVGIRIYEMPVDPEQELALRVLSFEESWMLLAQEPVDRWGQYTGSGCRIRVDNQGTRYRGLLFVTTTETGGFEIRELCAESEADLQEPGFRLIRDTFRLREE